MTKENLEQLRLWYCSRQMGMLERTKQGYKYTSNTESEQQLLRQGALDRSEYDLWGSKERESKALFEDFEKILEETSRKDILERAGINSNDSQWDRLVKLARLKYFPRGFYVQLEEKEKAGPQAGEKEEK